jgi:AraC-like DNA-binding protein
LTSPDLKKRPRVAGETRGILNPAAGLQRFDLRRAAPSAELAPFVDWYWVVRWSLPEPFEQEVLPHPCVNLSFDARGPAVHGFGTARAVARLEGSGRAVAAKFKPGGFAPFSPLAARDLVDRVVPAADAFGPDAGRLGRAIDAADDAAAVGLLEAFLRERLPPPDRSVLETIALAARAQADRDVKRAEDLARAAGRSVRTLQRAFERYVGVGPKWVIRRARVHEAAERAAAGGRVAWGALAHELGYHDQAHFIRDFKAQTGVTPATYARRCATARRGAGEGGAG